MINPEPLNHEYFEELCVLENIGQISADEAKALRNHLQSCKVCRKEQYEFVELLHKQIALVAPSHQIMKSDWSLTTNHKNLKKRFLRKAEERGVRFSSAVNLGRGGTSGLTGWLQPSTKLVTALACLSVVLLVALVALGFWWHKDRIHHLEIDSQMGRLDSENASLRHQIVEMSFMRPSGTYSEGTLSSGPLTTGVTLTNPDDPAALKIDLAKEQRKDAAASERARKFEAQLAQANLQILALKSTLDSNDASSKQLHSKLEKTQSDLDQMAASFKSFREGHADDAAALAGEKQYIDKLSTQLAIQTAALEREKVILGVSRDIRELMTARNLHMIDVYDLDGKGKSKRGFGRVFYTEGQSLIFYAYDLTHKASSASKVTFQAWGYREPSDGMPENLGTFMIDDKNQNRWVLRCDNPDILSRIDSLFVTAEPAGGSQKPSGRKLLYAYLKNPADRP
jgi:uncharacterized membrane-anchored protein YhcB (DUF1043 family)